MSERARNERRFLADLHEDALRETDAAATQAADRYMAWFDEQGAPGVETERPREGRPSVAPAAEATGSPEIVRFVPGSPRALLPIALPVALAAAAALAVWLVPHAIRGPAPVRSSPPTLPSPASPAPDGPCRSAIRARGDSPRIDDFEDGNELVALLEARNGYWVSLSDTDPEGAEPVLLPSLRPDPSPGNRYALHVTGPRHRSWGASVQVELGPSCYDASVYAGMAFDARGPGRLSAGIRTVDAVPVLRGGTCTEDCYRSHLGEVTLESEWKTYVLWWNNLHQEGETTPLDPRRANGVEFLLRPEDTPYDVWIDNVRFLRDATDATTP